MQNQPAGKIQPDNQLKAFSLDRHGFRQISIRDTGFAFERSLQLGYQLLFSRLGKVGLPLDLIQLYVGKTKLFDDKFFHGGFDTAAAADGIDSIKIVSRNRQVRSHNFVG